MKKSETQVADGESAKSQQPASEKLEAPIALTPEQLEGVAGGFPMHVPIPQPPTTLTGKAN